MFSLYVYTFALNLFVSVCIRKLAQRVYDLIKRFAFIPVDMRLIYLRASANCVLLLQLEDELTRCIHFDDEKHSPTFSDPRAY